MGEAGGRKEPPEPSLSQLLPFAILDHLVDFDLYGIEVEARGCLHRREIDGRLSKFRHPLLHIDIVGRPPASRSHALPGCGHNQGQQRRSE